MPSLSSLQPVRKDANEGKSEMDETELTTFLLPTKSPKHVSSLCFVTLNILVQPNKIEHESYLPAQMFLSCSVHKCETEPKPH